MLQKINRTRSPVSGSTIAASLSGLASCTFGFLLPSSSVNREVEIIVVGLIQGFDKKTLHPAIWYINLSTHLVQQFTSETPANPDKNKNYLQDEVWDEL